MLFKSPRENTVLPVFQVYNPTIPQRDYVITVRLSIDQVPRHYYEYATNVGIFNNRLIVSGEALQDNSSYIEHASQTIANLIQQKITETVRAHYEQSNIKEDLNDERTCLEAAGRTI